jgi:competence protein ComEC
MAGLLYGYRGGLGSLNTDFARTGVSHIVAVSGYNISLVTSICMIILIRLFWIPRKTAFWIIVSGIVLFVVFTGASSSVVRAGVMAIIVLLGGYLGRPRRTVNALVATAVVMVAVNPLILFWDVGFQLSFLSTLGIIYLSPPLAGKLNFLSEKFGLRDSLVSTLSAIMATLPLLLFQFGQVSLVAPVVNMLVLWIVPYVMMIGFAAVGTSWVWYTGGQFVAWVAYVGMMYVVMVVRWFASFPWAAINITLPMWAMVIIYVLIFRWAMINKNHHSMKSNI